nr:elongation factor P-like [Tanacetum cinerariifolium]
MGSKTYAWLSLDGHDKEIQAVVHVCMQNGQKVAVYENYVVTSQPSVNFSSLMIFATLFSLVIDILEKPPRKVTSIDIDSGNKVHAKFRADEPVGVFVDPKSFTYLYIDEESDSVVLMEPKTSVQVRVPKQLFGESLACLE